MVSIIPTILVKTFDEFQNTVKKIKNDFELAQIDVMDGKFVPNITFFDINAIRKIETSLQYELHLMVEDPLYYIRGLQITPWSRARGRETNYELKSKSAIRNPEVNNTIIKVLFHFESKGDIQNTIKAIRKLGYQVGLVINPETRADAVRDFLSEVDTVMVMGVHPGFSGQKFIPKTVDKVREIRTIDKNISIEIDGGVSDVTAPKLVEAGANILAVGSFIYQDEPKKQKKRIMKSITNKSKIQSSNNKNI